MKTLDEAIDHANEVGVRLSKNCDTHECGAEHLQLSKWLKELKKRRMTQTSQLKRQDDNDRIEIKALEELGASPAPWKLNFSDVSISGKDSQPVCWGDEDYERAHVVLADLYLIKAAPKMYDALYKVYKYLGLDKGVYTDELGDVIVKALEAANGEGDVCG